MANYHYATKVGDVHGRWTVLAMAGQDSQGQRMWTCECECGNKKDVAGYILRRGSSRSCGCITRVHGYAGTRIYGVWSGMIKRCYDENNCAYKYYGARGITVCAEWKSNPEAFIQWAEANGYEEDLTIERIDNDGNYEPSNCKWATMMEQGSNKRTNAYITINGETKTLSNWARHAGIPINTIKQRRFRGLEGADLIQPLHDPKEKKYYNRRYYDIGGGVQISPAEVEEKYGINRNTFIGRYNYGWRGEKLFQPVKKNKRA